MKAGWRRVAAFVLVTAGGAASASDTATPDLANILVRLARVAELYRDTALGFSCKEDIAYAGYGGSGISGHFQLVYCRMRDESGQLREFRTFKSGSTAAVRGREVRLSEYRAPQFVEHLDFAASAFRTEQQPSFRFVLLGEEGALGRAALKIGFLPREPIRRGMNDWGGFAWIDRTTTQILKVEAYTPSDWNQRAKREIDLANAAGRPSTWRSDPYDIRRVVMELGVDKNGLRLPSHAAIVVTHSTVQGGGGSDRLREHVNLRVDQTYSNYEFFGARAREEIARSVGGETNRPVRIAADISPAVGKAPTPEPVPADTAGQLEDASATLTQATPITREATAESLTAQSPSKLDERAVQAPDEAGASRHRADEIAKLMDDGLDLLQRGLAEQAAAAFTRVLALEPSNASAKANVALARNFANRTIAGQAPASPKLIPMIVLPGVDGATVSESFYSVAGSILDDGPRIRVAYALNGTPIGETATLEGTKAGNLYRFDFSQPVQLAPGPATLKITAIDVDELSGGQEYHLRYARPWQRSPWMYASAAALLLGIAGTAQGLKWRQRNTLLHRRFNPYVAGAPILENDLFIGREPLLARILETIHNNSILLYGERRIGKTSLQHHLKQRLTQLRDPDYEFYPVFIDLQGTPQEKFFATLAMEIFQELAPILKTPSPERDLREDDSYTYESFVRDMRSILKDLRERSPKKIKLALLIDEVDELNAYDPRVNQKLRSLFMKSFAENLVAVVSGVGIKKRWESEGSPWYNFFEEIEVRPFAPKDAVELIERPIRGVFRIDDRVVDRIVQLTDSKPYLIQKLCIALVNRMHEEKRRRITVSDVEAVGRPAEA